jgi:hypothetical protein
LAQADRSNIHAGISSHRSEFRSGEIAPEDHAIRPFDRSMKRDLKTRPRMKGVKQFPKLGPVGVLKPLCTIASSRMRLLVTNQQAPDVFGSAGQR